jgi:hypothetical protein
MPTSIEQEIFRLDITMGNAHGMQIRDAVQDLFETAFYLPTLHTTLLDRGIKVATGAVFHHFTPMMCFVLNQIDSFDNVDVVES